MIEPKDASKCDERRVKNKLNPLTHKKKGETRTMSIQGTKHWHVGMFFVISLMLAAGLFVDTASAQSPYASVSVSPSDGDSEEVLDSVYSTPWLPIRSQKRFLGQKTKPLDEDTDDDEDITNTIQIGLPTTWTTNNA